MRPLLAAFFFLPVLLAAAENPRIDREQAFLDLGSTAVVMDLSAHPDDEDGATLALYRMKYGVTTYSVLFTRGEGGQNEKGPELYEELGVIRSGETREAGSILGTNVVFLNFKDFGFSKTGSEALRIWGGQMEVLRRLVYAIRRYKPDVLFTNHNTIDGHGQHQAVAITAIAAFDAAADSTMFPEQLRDPGLSLWQPRKLFFRAFGRAGGTPDVSNPIDETDSLRGAGYLDIASEALRKHRTQGMERANLRAFTRGKSLYRLMRSYSLYEADTTSFLSGIDFWRDPALTPVLPLRALAEQLHSGTRRDSLIAVASSLDRKADSLASCCPLPPLGARIVNHWREAVHRAVMLTCGIRVTARLSDTIIVPGERVRCAAEVSSSECRIGAPHWSFSLPAHWSVSEQGSAPRPSGGSWPFTLAIGNDALPTLPAVEMQYRSLERHQDIEASVTCTVDGNLLSFSAPVKFDVAPRQTIEASPSEMAFIRGRTHDPVVIRYTVRSWQPQPMEGTVTVDGPWNHPAGRFAIPRQGGRDTGALTVTPPKDVEPGEYLFHVRTSASAAAVRVKVFDVNVKPGVRLGIIESYDNTLEAAARQLGVPFTMLDDSVITQGSLSEYSAIVVDIRAYLARPALLASNHRLLEFAGRGGTLLVMYQRDQEWKPEYAPYPFAITRRRVTVEEAPVSILLPGHPILTSPNAIGPGDWQGWKQERGLYFPGDVPPQYQRLLACADPDEEPLTTGLLVAQVGTGAYIYTSYVWYRQLKEEHPGAFRCFANMISYSPGRN